MTTSLKYQKNHFLNTKKKWNERIGLYIVQWLKQFPRQPIWIEGEADFANVVQWKRAAQNRGLAIELCMRERLVLYVSFHSPSLI